MFSMLAMSMIDRGFMPRSGQIKDYKIGICCISTKHAVLIRSQSKYWLARNQVERHVYQPIVVSVS